jgi:drug/metabolite transporter (DMT)-like permease
VLTYVLALLAACVNATSSVLQRKANREVPRSQNLSPRLIWSLAAAVLVLIRSPLLSDESAAADEGQPPAQRRTVAQRGR